MKTIIAGGVATLLLAGAAQAAGPTPVAGTHVTLTPPPGFQPVAGASGFATADASSTLMVIEVPGKSYEQIISDMQPGYTNAQGLHVLAAESARELPYRGERVEAEMQGARPGHVWMLIADGESFTDLVVFTGPPNVQPGAAAVAHAALDSVRLDLKAVVDPLAGLPFTLDVPKRFKYRMAIGQGGAMVKERPVRDEQPGEAEVLITRLSDTPTAPQQRQQRAEEVVQNLGGRLKDMEVQDLREIQLGGLTGMELVASGVQAQGRIKLIADVLFGEQGSWLLVAQAGIDRFDDAQADLRAVLASFRPR